MENDDILTREGEVSGAQRCQKNDQNPDIDPQNSHHVAQRHIHDESLALDEKATVFDVLPYERTVLLEPSSLQPAFSQRERHAYALESNLSSASVYSDTANVHRLELHAAEQEILPQSCEICGKKNSTENPRAMVRFLPRANESSDITLHVFCGKTASILPQVAQPHLEILLKAGLKNKHGIGPDVNFALARTRSAVAQGGEADKDPKRLDKEYYLVKEFEGHLRYIRSLQVKPEHSLPVQMSRIRAPVSAHTSTFTPTSGPARFFDDIPTVKPTYSKPRIHKASRNSVMAKGSYIHTQEGPRSGWSSVHAPLTSAIAPFKSDESHEPVYQHTDLLPHGKVRCPCGGLYNPTRGTSSWRAHVKTKKHLLWSSHPSSSSMSINGMAYTKSNNNLPLPTSELSQHNSLRVGPIGNDQRNYKDKGNHTFHTSEEQGNYAISQPYTNEIQGNYSLSQSHTSNGHGNYTAAHPHIHEEQVHYSNECHLEGTTASDTVAREESTTEETQR